MKHSDENSEDAEVVLWDDQSESFHEFFGGAGVAAVIYAAICFLFSASYQDVTSGQFLSSILFSPITLLTLYVFATATAALFSLPLFFINLSLGRPLSSKIYSLLSCGWGVYAIVAIPMLFSEQQFASIELPLLIQWHLYCFFPLLTLGHVGGYVMRSRWEKKLMQSNRAKGCIVRLPYSETSLSFGIKQIMILTIWFALFAIIYSLLPPQRWQLLIGFCICETAALTISFLVIRRFNAVVHAPQSVEAN